MILHTNLAAPGHGAIMSPLDGGREGRALPEPQRWGE
jgi:hypothetical protein